MSEHWGKSEAGGAVEAVGADFAFGEADAFDKGFDGIEFQRGQAETLADFFDEQVVALGAGGGVFVEVSVGVSFNFFDNSAREQFHVAFR